jgi:hypothetical protein
MDLLWIKRKGSGILAAAKESTRADSHTNSHTHTRIHSHARGGYIGGPEQPACPQTILERQARTALAAVCSTAIKRTPSNG